MTLIVQKLNLDLQDLNKLDSQLSKLEAHKIANINWQEYPYLPSVQFQIAHNGTHIALKYSVQEQYLRAVAQEANGPVWEDSCCEFFISFDSKNYYNLETNCIGTKLLGYGAPGTERAHAALPVIEKIRTQSSLGTEAIEAQEGNFDWNMLVVIPVESFYGSDIKELSGTEATANFYKCGDKTPKMHFVSWNPINLPQPMFHCPEFFGKIVFE